MRASIFKSEVAAAAIWSTFALFLSSSALAQGNGHLEVTTIVQKEIFVETEEGETTTQLVEAQSVVPGEKVVYTITFKNVGDAAAENVVITNPISESLTYVAGSASNGSMRTEFSADGGKTFGLASELRVVDGDMERPAATQDYTHVRWIMQTQLEVGAEGSASFAAVLQ
ncbi:MAG: DUF11 domain-containing protein [Gammaproteobacteria bacterium]|nr:DUF11 domain-containing protein [Gammaproteobacteria bacterium]